jgi:predicted phage terminase large subunit-like protein
MGYDRFIEDQLPPDVWKYLPHTFATVMSGGLWVAFKHLILLSHIITAAIAKGGGRIIISLPPRHGKSWFLSQWLPAWFLSMWPDKKVILSTYEANFAATWGRRVRNIIKQDGHRVGVFLAEDATASNNWETQQGGGMMTAGIGGPITGKGFHLGLIDDAHKNWQEAQSSTIRNMIKDWFDSTFYTRAEPGATIVVLMTRWHEDDLIGYLMREKRDDGWVHVRIPAIAEDWNGEEDVLGRQVGEALCPERYDITALNRIKANMTPMMWNALFQQRPAPMEGSIFLRKNWKYYKIPPTCNFILQSWDTASKKNLDSAYSVCTTWGVSDVGAIMLDRWREHVEFPQLRRAVTVQYMKWQPNVILIEDRDSGQALIQQLQQETTYPVLPIYPDMDKVIRAQAVSPMQESGRVWLPDPSYQSDGREWVGEFIDVCATFPNTLYKDDIDSMSQALAYIMTMSMSGSILSCERRRTSKLLENFRSMM